MAHSRFIKDTELTVRMTLVMFLLGGLFVALVVSLMFAFSRYALLIGLIGIGIAFAQWWFSDTMAMRAMGAREVTPEEDPELHGIIERLCALADMPKPQVAEADTDLPNAFATGRSPSRAVVCVTTGLLDRLDPDELEAVLAHELSHVAHRDVLVMTLASSAAIVGGMLMRFAGYGLPIGHGGHGFGYDSGYDSGYDYDYDDNGGSSRDRGVPAFLVALLVSLVVYAVSYVLIRLLSRYRELCADRSGVYLTQKPSALASALQKITGEIAAIPNRDLRGAQAMNAFFIAPAFAGGLQSIFSTHPSLERRLEQLARISAELGKPVN